MNPISFARTFPRQTVCCAAAVLLLGLAALLPNGLRFIPTDAYASVHTVLEFVAMAISAMVFALAKTSRHRRAFDEAILGEAFLAVMLIDLAHTLSYTGMPNFVTPSSPEKAIDFWLAARFVAAAALLAVAVLPEQVCRGQIRPGTSVMGTAIALAVVTAVWWIGLLHADSLPRTFLPGHGLTDVKIFSEYTLIAIHMIASWLLAVKACRGTNSRLAWLAAASLLMAATEVWFTLYATVTDLQNFMGHIYKMAAYALVWRALVVSMIEEPFTLAERESARYRTLVETLRDAIYVLDGKGGLITWNSAFAEMIGRSGENLQAIADDVWSVGPQTVTDDGCVVRQWSRQDGSTSDIEITSVPIEWNGAECRLCFGHDITERRIAQENLEQSHSELKRQFDERADHLVEANALNESIIAESTVGIAVYHRNGPCVLANEAFAKMIGGTKEAVSSQDFHTIPSWKPSGMLDAALSVLESGVPRYMNTHVVTTFGQDIWLECRFIRFMRGHAHHLLFLATDITKRQSLEAELRRSERLIRMVTDAIPGVVGYWTLEMRCAFANQSYLPWFGRRQDEMIGIGVREFLGEELFRKNELYINGALKGVRQKFERRIVKADGSVHETLFEYIPNVIENEVAGFLTLITDVTELKDSQTALQEANARLEERSRQAEAASRAKSAFLAMMSHELRTPMTGVIGMTDFLSETPLNEEQRLYIDTMRSSARTLLSVLNDILDYSKIEADHLDLDSIPLDAVTLSAETIRLFWPKAEENANFLSLDTNSLTILPVKGDPTRIKQVLGNLVSNAVKFTTNGRITIRLRHQDVGARVRLEFEIEDTGIGISEADRGRLFLPFSQTDAGSARKFGGTGLGLAISKRLVELMGGEISITSKPCCGSTFRFTCLVDRCKQEDLAVEPQETVAVRPMSILLAEDNAINRMIVKVGLENRNHAVTMVENGAEALETATARQFDVILMDMQMPVMDGMEATKRIRALPPPFSEVPIVALTADALPEHRAAYMKAGLTDFLTKPVEWNEVDIILAHLHPRQRKRSAMVRDIGHVITEDDRSQLVDNSRLSEIRNQMTPSEFNILIREIFPFTRDEVSKLKGAITHRNLPDARRAAHSIKGMFLNIGGNKIAAIAKEIQECENIDSANALFSSLSTAVNETAIEMERFTMDQPD